MMYQLVLVVISRQNSFGVGNRCFPWSQVISLECPIVFPHPLQNLRYTTQPYFIAFKSKNWKWLTMTLFHKHNPVACTVDSHCFIVLWLWWVVQHPVHQPKFWVRSSKGGLLYKNHKNPHNTKTITGNSSNKTSQKSRQQKPLFPSLHWQYHDI